MLVFTDVNESNLCVINNFDTVVSCSFDTITSLKPDLLYCFIYNYNATVIVVLVLSAESPH